MTYSRSLALLAASSVLGAAILVSGACSSSASIPTQSTPPTGVTFVGGTFGAACNGEVYAVAGSGWAFCDNDVWAYTTSDPANDGFTADTADAGPGSDAAPAVDAGRAGDANLGLDGQGPGVDGGQQGLGGGTDAAHGG